MSVTGNRENLEARGESQFQSRANAVLLDPLCSWQFWLPLHAQGNSYEVIVMSSLKSCDRAGTYGRAYMRLLWSTRRQCSADRLLQCHTAGQGSPWESLPVALLSALARAGKILTMQRAPPGTLLCAFFLVVKPQRLAKGDHKLVRNTVGNYPPWRYLPTVSNCSMDI